VEVIYTRRTKELGEHKKQDFIKDAPEAFIVIADTRAYYTKDKELNQYFITSDISAAIQNCLIRAEERHIGTCWVNVHPIREQGYFQREFSIPEYYQVGGLIIMGKNFIKPDPPGKKGLLIEKGLHYENWNFNASSSK